MQKLISAGSPAPVRVVIVTLDNHLASAAERAHEILGKELPGIEIALHATATFSSDPGAVSYTHLTLPTIQHWCRSRWARDH